MAASTITRATWTDDDGTGTTGTIINNALKNTDIYDKIDAMFAGSGSYTTLTFGGKIVVEGVGASFGAAARTQTAFQFAGAFAPTDGGVYVAGVGITVSVTGTPDDNLAGFYLAPTLVEAGSGTHALIASAHFAAPTITGAAATVTNAATVYIAGATGATVAGADYALFVDAGDTRLDGDLTVGGGDIIASANLVIRRDTVDGTDSGWIGFNGGGSPASTSEANWQLRGASIRLGGNEETTVVGAGVIQLLPGNVANAQILFYNAAASGMFQQLASNGAATFTSTTEAAWTFNSTHASGSYMTVSTSGEPVIYIGSAKVVNGALAATEGGITSNGNAIYYHSPSWPTTGSAADANVNSNGWLSRSTSSRRYKQDIRDLEAGLAELLQLRPISFKDKNPANEKEEELGGKWRHFGFIAEEMHEVMPNLVGYDNVDGEWVPGHIEYDYLTAPIVKAIQELHTRLYAAGF